MDIFWSLILCWGSFILVTASKPHVIAILADDYGWADAGWHRPEGYTEVQTPVMNNLVKNGIELDRHYVFKFCSPSRSATQTGRNPIHVNTLNLEPNNYNPKDKISGYSAVPRNMTGVAEVMKRGGYATHFAGKWDCGMATPRHAPRGRGYDTSLHYFHHMEDYWQNWFEGKDGITDFWPNCKKKFPHQRPRDLWLSNGTYDGPANDLINMTSNCSVGVSDVCSKQSNCHPYPGFPGPEIAGCSFVDETFSHFMIDTIKKHDPITPLFLFWAPHSIHTPLQVPKVFYDKFDFISDWRRKRYHAMVNFLDTKIGEVINALKIANLYDNSVIFFSSDNGGPIYSNGGAGANNYPLKGGKVSNWEGGIRVNAWVSGGALPKKMRGQKLEGLTTIWDWWATFAAIGGISDITDHAAAEAKLPPIDSLNLWPYLSGKTAVSPRNQVLLGTGDGAVNGVIWSNGTTIWKRLEGVMKMDGWTGPQCPNATFKTPGNGKCDPFCLFQLNTDPSEFKNLVNKSSLAGLADTLKAKIVAGAATGFHPDRGGQDVQSCLTAMERYNGWWGPWVDLPNGTHLYI